MSESVDGRLDDILQVLHEQRQLLNDVVRAVNSMHTDMQIIQETQAQHGTAIIEAQSALRLHMRQHSGGAGGLLTPLPTYYGDSNNE